MASKGSFTALFIGGSGFIIFNIIFYFMQLGNDDVWFGIYGAAVTTVWAFIAGILFLIVMKDFTLANPSGKIWLMLGLGILSWAIGELIWTIFTVLEEDPFPSIGDGFYLLAYIFVFLGLAMQLQLNTAEISSKEKTTIIIAEIFVTVLLVIFMIVPIFSDPDESLTTMGLVISIIYPVLDIILTPLALLLFFKFQGGEFGKSWLLISFGFFAMIAGDIIFGISADANFIFDHIYNLAYLLFALGALNLHNSLKA
jgi:hypothetical protein